MQESARVPMLAPGLLLGPLGPAGPAALLRCA